MPQNALTVDGLVNESPKTKRVFFTGTTELNEGVGLCYDYDRTTEGAATTAQPNRGLYVELPSVTNNLAFAGVTKQYYAANANGQWIEINEPGSFCNVRVSVSATLGVFYTCLIGDGVGTFGAAGFMGRGTFKALQTADGSSTNTTCYGQLLDGEESGLTHYLAATSVAMVTGGATALSTNGVTVAAGGTTPAGDATYTLGSGAYVGQKRRFSLVGALTTNDLVITFVGESLADGSTDVTTLELDGAGDNTLLVWGGTKWQVLFNAGTAIS